MRRRPPRRSSTAPRAPTFLRDPAMFEAVTEAERLHLEIGVDTADAAREAANARGVDGPTCHWYLLERLECRSRGWAPKELP